MSDYQIKILITFCTGGACILCLWAGFCLGNGEAKHEAVLQGHAEWVPDKDGKPTFQWKERK